MRGIIERINESQKVKFDETLTFNLTDDVYNILSDLAFQYNMANKGSCDDEREVAAALDNFMKKFFN